MLKRILFFALAISFALPIMAQYPKKKPLRIWYLPLKNETVNFTLNTKDFVSEKLYSKFKLTITNKTTGFLLVKPQECSFMSGSAEVVPNDKKTIKIRPLDTESKVIDGKSTPENSIYEYAMYFNLDGIYKSGASSDVMLPDFSVPPTQNIIEIGGFRVELLQHVINEVDPRYCWAKFRVTYMGEGIGIVDPRKISARTNSGEVLANAGGEKIFALDQGEAEVFYGKFTKGEPVTVIWNDAFKKAPLEKLNPVNLEFQYDPKRK